MNSGFEKRLQDVPMREVPGHWKAQIVAAAQQPQPAWWREWLWPCPRAWAGLAAAWGFILLLSVTTPDEPAAPGQKSSASWQSFAFLQQEAQIIAQLSGDEESRPATPPPPAATKPRSSRRVKQAIG
jgi:hypothetical protein